MKEVSSEVKIKVGGVYIERAAAQAAISSAKLDAMLSKTEVEVAAIYDSFNTCSMLISQVPSIRIPEHIIKDATICKESDDCSKCEYKSGMRCNFYEGVTEPVEGVEGLSVNSMRSTIQLSRRRSLDSTNPGEQNIICITIESFDTDGKSKILQTISLRSSDLGELLMGDLIKNGKVEFSYGLEEEEE